MVCITLHSDADLTQTAVECPADFPYLTAWIGSRSADHRRKREAGDDTVTRGLDTQRPVTEKLQVLN